MKKRKYVLIIFAVSLLIIFLYQSDTKAAFSIELNFYSIDFGELNMGDTKDGVPGTGLIVTCTTDQAEPWSLTIRNEGPLTHTSNPASIIPNTNLYWYGVSSSVPGNPSLITSQQDFTLEKTVYSAPDTEGASGTQITMKFKVDVPSVVQSGTYNTNIVFTFTE